MQNQATKTREFLDRYAQMRSGAKFHLVNGVGFYTLPSIERLSGFDHGFTARSGGVSEGYFSSLNLSFTRPENRENVMENYRIFCRAAQIPFETMVMDNYEHGTNVIKVDRADAGKGYLLDPLPSCDGLVTNDPAVTLIFCLKTLLFAATVVLLPLSHALRAPRRVGSFEVRGLLQTFVLMLLIEIASLVGNYY